MAGSDFLEVSRCGLMASHVSADLDATAHSAAELRERMSGNICRCAAYSNIIAAIEDVAGLGQKSETQA